MSMEIFLLLRLRQPPKGVRVDTLNCLANLSNDAGSNNRESLNESLYSILSPYLTSIFMYTPSLITGLISIPGNLTKCFSRNIKSKLLEL